MIPLAKHPLSSQSNPFRLTAAIRPGVGVPVGPTQGYRIERFRDPVSRRRLPMLAASVTAEQLFDVFLDLMQPLGESVQVVLETSHESRGDYHRDLRRDSIDLPVLASHFCDFEDLITNDGCLGVAVLAENRPIEVQLDEHKLLFVYAEDLKPFRRILRSHNVQRHDTMRLIAEAEHVHYSAGHYLESFRQLACRIGVGDFESVLTDFSGSEE